MKFPIRLLARTAIFSLAVQAAGLAHAASPPSPAAAPEWRGESGQKKLATVLETYLKASVRNDYMSGTVLVARNGVPLFERAYGMANYELGVPNRLDTVYNLGSIVKQFTATAVMQLQEAGKLTTADPICKHLADCPAAWRKVTIRHLLNHSSGVPNFTGLPEWDEVYGLKKYRPGELLALFRDLPLDFAPGEKHSYSNSGYYLLGLVIERLSGKSFDDYLRSNFFAPLGMKSTLIDNNRGLIPRRAGGYYSRGPYFVNPPFEDPTTSFGAGGIWSTTRDLLKWERAIDQHRFLSAKSLAEVFTPSLGNYGYGWRISDRWGRRTMDHSGSQNGFSTFIIRIPDDQLTIVVLGNSDRLSAGRVGVDLAAIVLGQKYVVPQPRLRDILWRKMESNGIAAALQHLRDVRARAPAEGAGDDELLLDLGYELVDARKLDEAEAVFRFNLGVRPKSAYSFDGLADVALARGDKAKAVQLFTQSLTLDPDNDYAKRALARMRK